MPDFGLRCRRGNYGDVDVDGYTVFMEYNRISSGIGIIGGSNFEAALFTTQITVSSIIPFIVVSLFFIVSLIIFIVNLIKMLSSKKTN